jgi:hypothetical protein
MRNTVEGTTGIARIAKLNATKCREIIGGRAKKTNAGRSENGVRIRCGRKDKIVAGDERTENYRAIVRQRSVYGRRQSGKT